MLLIVAPRGFWRIFVPARTGGLLRPAHAPEQCCCRASPVLLPGDCFPGTVAGGLPSVPVITSAPSCTPSGPASGRPKACFRPPALPGFSAIMGALTPARGCTCGLLSLAHIPCSLPRRSLHVTRITFRALRLQTPHRLLRSLCHLSCQRRRLPAHRGSGLRPSTGGSPVGAAESSSCPCGLPVRLPLLPTLSRDDAVSVGYRTNTGIAEGGLHLSDVARLWTHDGRAFPGQARQ